MILVATVGQAGYATARLLSQQHEPVRILVRDAEKAVAARAHTRHAASRSSRP